MKYGKRPLRFSRDLSRRRHSPTFRHKRYTSLRKRRRLYAEVESVFDLLEYGLNGILRAVAYAETEIPEAEVKRIKTELYQEGRNKTKLTAWEIAKTSYEYLVEAIEDGQIPVSDGVFYSLPSYLKNPDVLVSEFSAMLNIHEETRLTTAKDVVNLLNVVIKCDECEELTQLDPFLAKMIVFFSISISSIYFLFTLQERVEEDFYLLGSISSMLRDADRLFKNDKETQLSIWLFRDKHIKTLKEMLTRVSPE